MATTFDGEPASYNPAALPELLKARDHFLNGGVHISLHTDHEKAGVEGFSGGCHGAGGGGCAGITTAKSNVHELPTAMDMDAATGCHRRPGCAGAHPTMQQAQGMLSYAFMVGQAKSLVKPEEQNYDGTAANPVQETD